MIPLSGLQRRVKIVTAQTRICLQDFAAETFDIIANGSLNQYQLLRVLELVFVRIDLDNIGRHTCYSRSMWELLSLQAVDALITKAEVNCCGMVDNAHRIHRP